MEKQIRIVRREERDLPGNRAEAVWELSREKSEVLHAQLKTKQRLFGRVKLKRLGELESYTSGLMPGVYLVAADTNVGKTSLLTSLAIDIVEQNPEVCVTYLSFDDDHWEVHNRLSANLAEVPIEESLIFDFATKENRSKFAQGAAELDRLHNSRNLLIADAEMIANLGVGDNLFDQVLSGMNTFIREQSRQTGNKPKQIVICIDNVSNLNLHNPKDQMDGTGALMRNLHKIAEEHKVSLFLTTESSDKDTRKGKPRGSLSNGYASRMLYNLRDPKPLETSQFGPVIIDGHEKLMILDVLKNKASGRKKTGIPLAVNETYGQVRTVSHEREPRKSLAKKSPSAQVER